MAFDYPRAQAAALRLIQNFGFVSELRAYSDAVDPITGVAPSGYLLSHATIVSVPSSSMLTSFDDAFRDNLTAGKARVFLMAATGLEFEPEPGHCILHEGKLWEIGSGAGRGGIMPLNPAGTPLMYTCGCMAGGRNPSAGAPIDPDTP